MQAQNLGEYECARREMLNLKDCITSYMGYVLGGTGLAMFGLASLGKPEASPAAIAYVALVLSLIVSLVLLILLYKFNSHNRIAGYSKLLNHERHDVNPGHLKCDVQLFAWEILLERLRQSDLKPGLLKKLSEQVNIKMSSKGKADLKWIVQNYAGTKAPIDRQKYLKGVWQLIKALLGKGRTNSWGFPPLVTAVFFVLCIAFMAVGVYGVLRFWNESLAVFG